MNDIVKACHCPVRWRCLSLGYIITVSPEALYDISNGWICDCGERVKDTGIGHYVLNWGLRDGMD